MIYLWESLSIRTAFYEFLDHFYASYTRQILLEAISLLGQLWPYLVMGILVSTLVKTLVSRDQMIRFFSKKRSGVTILLAAFIGALSPVGSYVMIPMSAALLGVGVPLPALMALMVSSPLINPNLFVLTAGAMGLEMALLRAFSALLLGSLAGYLALWLIRTRRLDPQQMVRNKEEFKLTHLPGGTYERSWKGFLKELVGMTRYVSKYFFLAIVLAAAIKIVVNPEVIVSIFDSDSILSVIISTGAGVPFYVCGGAAIPVVQQLAALGMSKGAVLAYFISGPVTKISNLVILQAAFQRTVVIQYLAIGILGAMVMGLLYNLF